MQAVGQLLHTMVEGGEDDLIVVSCKRKMGRWKGRLEDRSGRWRGSREARRIPGCVRGCQDRKLGKATPYLGRIGARSSLSRWEMRA